MTDRASPSVGPGRPSPAPPYPPSWIDALVARVGRLPGPAWAAYLVALVGFAVLNNVVFWLDGSSASGTFDFTRTVDAFNIVYFLALFHHLGSVAGRCLQAFEPLLDASLEKRAASARRLTRLPRRFGWVAMPFGLVVGVGSAVGADASMGLDVARTPLPFVYQGLAPSFTLVTMGALSMQVIRQLRIVGILHRSATGDLRAWRAEVERRRLDAMRRARVAQGEAEAVDDGLLE